jgi:hypothetical protein
MENYFMLKKILKYIVLFIMLFLILGIYVHYDLIKEQPRPEFICYKGKLLKALEIDDIYVKVVGTQCELFEDLIIVDKEVVK